MSKVLVIGAGGFIGSYIVPLLGKHHEVITIYKNEIDILDNQTVTTLLDLIRPDVIINCLTFGGKTELNENNAENVGKNMALFYNFYTNEDKFKFYINLGSGIEKTKERNAYAFSKRMIRNLCFGSKYLTLRLYGCFGAGEPSHRLLKKYNASVGEFKITNDREFDYFSVQDLYNVIEYSVENYGTKDWPVGSEIDCVYHNKITLSEFLGMYCDINNIEKRFVVESTSEEKYTGNYTDLYTLQERGGLKLYGIGHGLKVYND
jgi:nucleoside-diphosphate-sugar epimerase